MGSGHQKLHGGVQGEPSETLTCFLQVLWLLPCDVLVLRGWQPMLQPNILDSVWDPDTATDTAYSYSQLR